MRIDFNQCNLVLLMVAILINDEERDALRERLNNFQRCVYLLGIRPYMDFATGIVGVKRGISFRSIAEEVYIAPLRGRHDEYTGMPDKEKVRKAIKYLEKSGLIKNLSEGGKLIFECILATKDKYNRNMMDASRTHRKGMGQEDEIRCASTDSWNENLMRDTPGTAMRDTPPYIRNINNINIINNINVIFEHWRDVMDHPRAKLDNKRKSAIKKALELGYDVEQLKQAITGCSKTPFNMGDNDRGQRYDSITLILRDADHIDRFINNYHNPPAARVNKNEANRRNNEQRYENTSQRASRLLAEVEQQLRNERRTIDGECFEPGEGAHSGRLPDI